MVKKILPILLAFIPSAAFADGITYLEFDKVVGVWNISNGKDSCKIELTKDAIPNSSGYVVKDKSYCARRIFGWDIMSWGKPGDAVVFLSTGTVLKSVRFELDRLSKTTAASSSVKMTRN